MGELTVVKEINILERIIEEKRARDMRKKIAAQGIEQYDYGFKPEPKKRDPNHKPRLVFNPNMLDYYRCVKIEPTVETGSCIHCTCDACLSQNALEAIRLERYPRMDAIINWVSIKYGISVNYIKSTSREFSKRQAYFEFCFIANYNPDRSLKNIGNFLGGRDHTTVLHAINRYKGLQLESIKETPDALIDRKYDLSKIIPPDTQDFNETQANVEGIQ